MKLRRSVTAVIFDMDGVLLDTERYYTEVTQAIVARYGKTFDWSVKRHMVGRPAIESARFLVETLALPMSAEDYLRERVALLEERLPGCRPMPGARELSGALAKLEVKQAVATSSDSRMYGIKTQHHRDWFRSFSTVTLGDDSRIRRGKPAPDIFLLTAEELNTAPSECLVVEDSPAGIAAARSAGMQCVAVPDPAIDREPFEDADLVVKSLADLSPRDLGFERRAVDNG